MTERLRHPVLRRLPLAVVVIAAAIGFAFFRNDLSPAALSERAGALGDLRDRHYGVAVLLFMAIYVAIVALSLPGATLATLTGGMLFGLFPGVIYNAVAATVGAVLVFLAIRAGVGAEVAARLARRPGAPARVLAGLRRHPWAALMAMRLAPVVPFFMANLLPAFTGIGLWPFAVTTALGILPGTVILTSVGQGLRGVVGAGGQPDLSVLTSAGVLVPLFLLAGLSLLPLLIRRGRGAG